MDRTSHIYRFGLDAVDGDGTMRTLLGGKGAGLAEMSILSIPVPDGFTITTEVCAHYLFSGALPPELHLEIAQGLDWLQNVSGKNFGCSNDPLLVSVRSGAPVSMPGMMDTILNIGVNDACLHGLAEKAQSTRFALDSYKRLLQMFGTVVLEVPKQAFEAAVIDLHQSTGELSEIELKELIEAYKRVILSTTGQPFPQDPNVQLTMAIEAVFKSWHSDRAKYYRQLNNISEDMGTAVTVQRMVFGNRGLSSGTGVGFTRNPSTGAPGVFGEYLADAQGEDIVAGIRTPVAISELAIQMPAVYEALEAVTSRLERHFRDVQDFEFTVECGKLFLLQTRAAKRAALASVRIAVDMVHEGLISEVEAVSRVRTEGIAELLSPQLDLSGNEVEALTTGLPASPGSAVGTISLSAAHAVERSAEGQKVILVTEETSADDIRGMAASAGLLTARGGATSHAAVVARGMGKCCITGAKRIEIDHRANTVRIGDQLFRQDDWISLEGSTGRVFAGQLPLKPANVDQPELETLMTWARRLTTCVVRANADTPEDASASRRDEATGIGLCRTEHMFFDGDRLPHVRDMILATTREDRVAALRRLLPMQQHDFEDLFRVMSPLPVTIRLLDPPFHEFLPSVAELDTEIEDARRDEQWETFVYLQKLRQRVEQLTEVNPMMGHRGCRLSLTYPEILEMQVRAILQAALKVTDEGHDPVPEIMVPLVASEQEMRILSEMIHEAAHSVFAENKRQVAYSIGSMIELPRAAVCAGGIAKYVSFMSFGTNDLTQMTFGFSRDDAPKYLDSYLEQGILKSDPFVTIDQEGVGALMTMAINSARQAKPLIKIGVCGEHGGEAKSIHYFQSLGVDYVSCSPARLRVAQLAAAQSSITSTDAASACRL